jgi:hypothetical protein
MTTALCLASVLAGADCTRRDDVRSMDSTNIVRADTTRSRTDSVRERSDGARRTDLEERSSVGTGDRWPLRWRTDRPRAAPFEVARRTADPASARPAFRHHHLTTSLRSRAPNVGQHPCTSCHLGRRMVLNDASTTHQNIKPVHPAQTGAACLDVPCAG